MPMPYNPAVMTNDGIALLTRCEAGECNPEFTRMVIGNGTYSAEEETVAALQARTSLKSEKNSYTLSGMEIYTDSSIKLTALLTNQDPVTLEPLVTSGYYINEIGVYAKEKDGGSDTEILYSIATTSGSQGDYMPPYNGSNPAEITQDYYCTVANATEVTIDITGAALTVKQANEMKAEVDERLDGHDTDIGEIGKRLDGHDTDIANADKDIATNASDISTLQSAHDDLVSIVNVSSAGAHNAIFRGKYLGTSVTDAQYNAIDDGTFDDLYIGDYWTINGINWVIADPDYWLYTGDSGYSLTKHHIVIVPSNYLENEVQMNDSNTTEGGYTGSYMYTTGLDNAKAMINSAFGSSHILSHREYLTNAVTSGYPSGCEWVDSTVELMNEEMVYGCPILQQTRAGGSVGNPHTIDKSQLALFRYDTSAIVCRNSSGTRYYWWLRDVASASAFALVNSTGIAAGSYASSPYGVRPCFAICKS